jgi:hypothetical protein
MDFKKGEGGARIQDLIKMTGLETNASDWGDHDLGLIWREY